MRHATILRKAGRIGLYLAICIGLFSVPMKSQAEQPQADATAGAEDADRAYGEVAAKNYTGAMLDFRRALASDPTNAVWRTDLGFACLAAGLPEEAAPEFSRVYSEHPEDFGVALQLGYLSQQLHRSEEASKYYEKVAQNAGPELAVLARKALLDLQASQLYDLRQQGYALLDQHRSNEAIKVFETIHRDDPSDAGVTMQLGYLYTAAGRMGDAREMFTSADKDADSKIVAQANAGLEQIRRDTKLWFASFYAEPFYQSRFSNEINPVNAKMGLSLGRYFQPYIGLRFNRDVRSVAGSLPQIYSDNTATVSIGVQSALAHTGAVVYAEAGTAVNLIGERPLAASDYRVGIVWFRGWGTGLFAPWDGGHSVSPTGSAYADAGFYSRYDHNVVANVQLRQGVNLPIVRALPMQLLAATNLIKDSNGNFYNNVIEVGPVLRIAPSRRLPSLSFEVQYMRGFYDAHDRANPYGAGYGDFRVLLIWSKTF